MPIYEYACETCGTTFDKFVRSMTAQVDVECPQCHSKQCHKNITRFGTTSSGGGGSSYSSASNCAPTGG